MLIALLNDSHFGVRNDSQAFRDYQLKFFDEQFFPLFRKIISKRLFIQAMLLIVENLLIIKQLLFLENDSLIDFMKSKQIHTLLQVTTILILKIQTKSTQQKIFTLHLIKETNHLFTLTHKRQNLMVVKCCLCHGYVMIIMNTP